MPLGRILNTKPSSFPFSFSLAGLESQALSKDLTEKETIMWSVTSSDGPDGI